MVHIPVAMFTWFTVSKFEPASKYNTALIKPVHNKPATIFINNMAHQELNITLHFARNRF